MKKLINILLLCLLLVSLGACQNHKNKESSPEKSEVSSKINEEKLEQKTNPATVTVVDEDKKNEE